MNKFMNSICKILDYERLASFLLNQFTDDMVFIDLGSGYCNLIKEIQAISRINCFGIDNDVSKIKHCLSEGFNVIYGDVRKLNGVLQKIEGYKIVHAGFCLFNLFPQNVVVKIVENIASINSVEKLIFEIQNKDFFNAYFPSYKKHKVTRKDIDIISWNKPKLIGGYPAKVLYMHYYDKVGNLINRTKDVLYEMDLTSLITEIKKKSFKIFDIVNWEIRSNFINKKSHYYIICKR